MNITDNLEPLPLSNSQWQEISQASHKGSKPDRRQRKLIQRGRQARNKRYNYPTLETV